MGNKLKKITTEGNKKTTTLYLFGTYQNDTLQYFSMEEGRIRPLRNANGNITSFTYDYFIKDDLGNVRMVLTEENKTDAYPAATMETSSINSESAYYSNLTSTQYPKPSWFNDPIYSGSTQVARVKNTAATQKIGPNILLKVMAGDSYNIRVASGWSSGILPTNSPAEVLTELVLALSGKMASTSGGKATQLQLQNPSGGLTMGVSNFLSSQTNTGTAPKAYINWILFDEQFQYYSGGFEQVGASGVTTQHLKNALTITKNGYLYIYTSNEATNIDVFFDNLQVTHTRSPLLEETHYYPGGLTMAGISSRAANSLENRKKFNGGTEFTNDFDISLYETSWRGYDPQIGRFHQIDMLAHTTPDYSPYTFVQNNPILFFDPLGLDTVRVNGEGSHKVKVAQGDVLAWTIGKTTSYYTYDPNNPDAVGGFVGAGMDGGTMEEVTVTATAKPKQSADYSTLASWQLATGYAGLGLDAYMNGAWRGPYNYRTSGGVVQSVFDTKYGQGRSPSNLGNINNYSKNAQRAIRTTKFLRGASNTLIVAGLAMDWGQVAYAVATDDPNKNIFIMKSSVNTTFAAYGVLVPGVGWVVSGVYFLGDALLPLGGWGGAMEAGYQNTLRNREIIPNWNPRPGGGLGN